MSMTTRGLPFEPRSFGRRRPFQADDAASTAPSVSEDLKLFATTYAAGFVLVWLYLI